MPKPSSQLYTDSASELKALGSRLKDARLRRRFSMQTVCAQANLSRPTLYRVETGDPAVTMGSYLQVMRVLGFTDDLAWLAKDDIQGRKLQDEGPPVRQREPKRRSTPGMTSVSMDLL